MDDDSDTHIHDADAARARNKISKSLSKRKDALQKSFESYLMTCSRTNGILALHTGAYKPQIVTGGPAIAALGELKRALDIFLRGVVEGDPRCAQVLQDFMNDVTDAQPTQPTVGFFEKAVEDRIILPDQVPKLKAALVTYLADDGHKKQSKGRTAPVGKGNQHAKATLHNHVGGMRTQLEGGAPAMGTATVATAPAMHAQMEGGAPAMGAATAATTPAMQPQMEGAVVGLTAAFDTMFEQIGYDVNEHVHHHVRRRGRTIVHAEKVPSRSMHGLQH